MMLNRVLSKQPWTLVLLLKLRDLGGEAAELDDVREPSVRTYIVKRGM